MDLLKELYLWFWNCGVFLFLWVLVGVLLRLSLLSWIQVILHLLEFLSSFLELTDGLLSLWLILYDVDISSSLSRNLTSFLWTILLIWLWLYSIILFILLPMVSLIRNSLLVKIVLDVNPLVVAYWISCLLCWLLEMRGHGHWLMEWHWHWLKVSLLHGHVINIWVCLHLLLLETQLFLKLSDKESLSLLVQQKHLRITASLNLLLRLDNLRWMLHWREESTWRMLLGLVVLKLLELLIIRSYLLIIQVRNRSELLVSYLLLPLFL